MLEVSETFRSLQGEGPLMGRPAFFLRLAGCVEPLCPWCDTPEGLGSGTSISVEDIVKQVDTARDRLVVITGGEPFLQWGADLQRLEQELLGRGIRVQYETSGKLVLPEDTLAEIVCSPKYLGGSWQFRGININRPITAYKFVVDGSLARIVDFIARYTIPHDRVWIMGEGKTRAEQMERAGELWQFCVDHGFNYSPRLHILTFDTKRSI